MKPYKFLNQKDMDAAYSAKDGGHDLGKLNAILNAKCYHNKSENVEGFTFARLKETKTSEQK